MVLTKICINTGDIKTFYLMSLEYEDNKKEICHQCMAMSLGLTKE